MNLSKVQLAKEMPKGKTTNRLREEKFPKMYDKRQSLTVVITDSSKESKMYLNQNGRF